jgi:hypothetical protein
MTPGGCVRRAARIGVDTLVPRAGIGRHAGFKSLGATLAKCADRLADTPEAQARIRSSRASGFLRCSLG